ncbi:MAG: hypothetical protein HYU36_00925 [Planctomycetes bacterium]|nr:hypothetical protein [Planctomycetota bacterium]
MNVLRGIFIWLNFLLGMVGGAILLLWPQWISDWLRSQGDGLVLSVSPPAADRFLSLLAEIDGIFSASLASAVIGAGLVSCSLLFFWTTVRRGARGGYASHLEFADGEGGFRIAVKALEQSLGRTLQTLPEVYDMRVEIQARRAEGTYFIQILAFGSVFENNDLHRVREKIRATLRHHFHGMLHLTENVKYDVHLHRIVSLEKRGKKPAPTEGYAPETGEILDITFTGPKYPVEAENEGAG